MAMTLDGFQCPNRVCIEIARDKPGQSADCPGLSLTKVLTLNVVFTSLNFGLLRSKNPPYGASNLLTLLKCVLSATHNVAAGRTGYGPLATVNATL